MWEILHSHYDENYLIKQELIFVIFTRFCDTQSISTCHTYLRVKCFDRTAETWSRYIFITNIFCKIIYVKKENILDV